MKRALLIAAVILALPFIIGAVWRIARVATTPEDSPRHALNQLASAARLGWWSVADRYADRKAMREEIRAALEEQAMNLARRQCQNCEPETIEARFRARARSVAASESSDDGFLASICRAADDDSATITVGHDGNSAVANYAPVRGITLRLVLKRADLNGRWKVVSVPSALEMLENAGQNVERENRELTRK